MRADERRWKQSRFESCRLALDNMSLGSLPNEQIKSQRNTDRSTYDTGKDWIWSKGSLTKVKCPTS